MIAQRTLTPGRACAHCNMEITSCRGCGEEILFGTTERGAKVPLDARLTRIMARGGDRWIEVRGHVSHFITCTKREAFKT